MIEKMPHGVSLHGRVVLRGGKFDKYFNVAVPAGVSADDLKKCFADAGANMSILLRLFDKSQTEREVFMLWKHCPVCNQDFNMVSDVCPNHTGHTLVLIIPQPEDVVEKGGVKTPKMPPVIEEKKAEEEVAPAPPDPSPEVTVWEVPTEPPAVDPFAIKESGEVLEGE